MNITIETEVVVVEAVILADGDFPSHPLPLSLLRDAPFLCCCDGAAVTALEHNLRVDAVVGDGDSLPKDLSERYKDIVHIATEQEHNDLTKATRYCVEHGFRHIAYIGCTGKREDHTLGNIALLAYHARELGVYGTMISDYGMLTAATGRRTFATFERQQVSIFNLGCTTLTSEGLRWNTYPFTEWWQGTVNEPIGATFTLDGDGYYVVFQSHEPKR